MGMLSRFTKIQRFMVVVTILMIIGWILYGLFGHGLLASAYDGKSVSLLNKVITGQDVHAVFHYQRLADRFFFRITIYVLVFFSFILLPRDYKLSIFSFIVTIMIIEAGFHVHDYLLSRKYPEPKEGEGILWEYDEVLGWKKKANADSRFVEKAKRFNTPVQTNSKGLRDDEYEYEKSEGVTRILIIGDSVPVGLEVEEQYLLDKQMEDVLSQHANVEVINAGTRGYGTDQSYLFLKNEGYKYNPDIIIYIHSGNDFIENGTVHKPYRAFGKSYFLVNENDELELKGVPVPKKFIPNDIWMMSDYKVSKYYNKPYTIQSDSLEDYDFVKAVLMEIRGDFPDMFVLRWVKSRIVRVKPLRDFLVRMKVMTPPVDWEDYNRLEYVKNFEERLLSKIVESMDEFSDSINAKFLAHAMTVYGGGEDDEQPTRLEKIAQKIDVEYHDCIEEFYEKGKEDRTYYCFKDDPHWNPKGHRKAAECIAKHLLSKGWL